MIDKKLGYSKKTQELIERMCRNVERKDFKLEKKKAGECILKTYDLFGLDRPKKVVWCVDVFDKIFAMSARSAWSAGSAGSAWSARSAGSAGSAWSARSAWSAGSAWSARSAGSAWSARSAGSAGWTALDYDFDWYVTEYEYCQNPSNDKPNENDKNYLKYSELLMNAKEYGLGYRVEWEDTLYLVPTPLVKIDSQNRFHSETEPAIRWKGGKGFYFLQGVKFEKKWWDKIVNDKMSAKTVLAIDNAEHRRIAYEYMDKKKMKALKDYKVLEELKDDKGYPMKIISFELPEIGTIKYLNCFCPSTGREYFIGTDKDKCKEAKDASFGLENINYINEW